MSWLYCKVQKLFAPPKKCELTAVTHNAVNDVNADSDDQIWLQKVNATRAKAIDRLVSKEIKRVQNVFLKNARRGKTCTVDISCRQCHRETVSALLELGFCVWIESNECFIALPLSCDDDKWSAWREQIRSIYLEAKKKTANRQFAQIKREFERAAKKRQSIITWRYDNCNTVAFEMLQQRLGCKAVTFRQGPYTYYRLSL